MWFISLSVCVLYVGLSSGLSDQANSLMDKILEEGNGNVQLETYLPGVESHNYSHGIDVRVIVDGMKVIREPVSIRRTQAAKIVEDNDGHVYLRANLTSGIVKLISEKVTIVTPWKTYNSFSEVTYTGEFGVESVLDKSADCENCTAALRVVHMEAPQLTGISSAGITGKIFDFMVRRFRGSPIMANGLLDFLAPAFTEAILKQFQTSVKNYLCNCTDTSRHP